MKEIIYVTGNQNKFDEFRRLLPQIKVKREQIDIEEIQSLDLGKIVESKARQAYKVIKSPLIVEDTSLVFHAFGNLPGPLIRWFEKELGHTGLCRILNHYKKDRSATAEVMYGYFDGKKFESFSGKIKGKIAAFPRGKNGFSWDNIFIPEGSSKTFAQMSQKEKDQISMRRIAAEKLKKYLK